MTSEYVKSLFEGRAVPAPETGCLLWEGSKSSHGYGILSWREGGGKYREYAHRLSLRIAGHRLPPKAAILNTCGNQLCVAPAHLQIGTQADVVQRAHAKKAAETSMEEIFQRSYEVAPDGCWLWRGARNPAGYGRISHAGRQEYAHRYSMELDGRPLGPGMHACHHCDNPPCVNPAHLFAGTMRDNIRDAAAKGRTSRKPSTFGETHHKAKLTEASVQEIRAALTAGSTIRGLARQYGVTQGAIQGIHRGTSWRHLP